MGVPASYAELQTQIKGWIDDGAIDAAECIGLAEARLSRLLTGPEMEAQTNLLPAGGAANLPDGFLEVRSLYLDADLRIRLEPAPLAIVQAYQAATGVPNVYCITGDAILVAPTPDGAYALGLVYRRAIPALSATNPTNWLLARHPDLYLIAALTMAEYKGWNDARLPLLKASYDALVAEVNDAGMRKRRGGPIRLRAPVSESVRATRSAVTGLGIVSTDFLADG